MNNSVKCECDKCHKELPVLGGKYTIRYTAFCSYLGHEIDLCSDCYEHFQKAKKVFEHEFLTGSPRECATLQLNFNKENLKELCDKIVEQIRNGELQLVEGPSGEWNPLSDGRPVGKGYYLTTTIHHEVYCDYWNGENFERTEDVIAWMPLPEPYKGGEES